MHVLIVEDERRIASFVARGLSREGYAVQAVADGDGALASAARQEPALVLLDVMLPGRDGIAVLRELMALKPTLPVMMLSARSDPETKVAALRAGAIDYVAKPFQMEEVLARIRALIRRAAGHATAELEAMGVRVDTRSGRVTRDGAPVKLTAQEYRLLSYLMHHRERVVPQTELIEHIYAQGFDRDSNTVEVFIARLRRKLGSARIEAVRGFGYRIVEAP